MGSDSLHSKLLKETIECLILRITNIFNKSLEYGKLPRKWKTANITRISERVQKYAVSNKKNHTVLLQCYAKFWNKS